MSLSGAAQCFLSSAFAAASWFLFSTHLVGAEGEHGPTEPFCQCFLLVALLHVCLGNGTESLVLAWTLAVTKHLLGTEESALCKHTGSYGTGYEKSQSN